MSENKDTSGPAFPDWPESAFPSTFQSLSPDPHQVHRWGMTLRDYFAAKAMEGLISGTSLWRESDGDSEIAECAYAIADAMLKVRK